MSSHTGDKQQWIDGVRTVSQRTIFTPLGITIVDVSDDYIELRMPITDASRQPMGMLHGGVSMVLAEAAASTHAAWGIDLNEKIPVGIEINGSHLRSASEGMVRAVGKVLRRTGTLIFHQVDIIHEATGEVLSTARVTNYYKPVRRASSPD